MCLKKIKKHPTPNFCNLKSYYVRSFVIYCSENNIEANSRSFDDWVTAEVQDESYKANLEIDKYFGTSMAIYWGLK